MKKIVLVAAVAAAVSAAPAFSQQQPWPGGWYIGAAVGQGNLSSSASDLGLGNPDVAGTATTYTGRFGYNFNPYLGLEAGYYDYGSYDFSGNDSFGTRVNGTARVKSYGLAAVGTLPIDMFDLYARVGWVNSEIKVSATTADANANKKNHDNGVAYGVGARWHMTREWGLFAEWMKDDEVSVDGYMIGIDYRFQ
ncbi:MAG TPA: outer membrane beta-barrel protein [Usitatibacter sp.]